MPNLAPSPTFLVTQVEMNCSGTMTAARGSDDDSSQMRVMECLIPEPVRPMMRRRWSHFRFPFVRWLLLVVVLTTASGPKLISQMTDSGTYVPPEPYTVRGRVINGVSGV